MIFIQVTKLRNITTEILLEADKTINGGGQSNRLQSKVTVNHDFMEAVTLPTMVNPLMEVGALRCPPPLINLKNKKT